MMGFLNQIYQIFAKHAAPHIARQASAILLLLEDNPRRPDNIDRDTNYSLLKDSDRNFQATLNHLTGCFRRGIVMGTFSPVFDRQNERLGRVWVWLRQYCPD
jgi:hypothetical protein